ncbi:DUF5129 domain-containing protein [Glutamicibacter sp. JC586]|uniref:DUF5129 domain-containing protein n=1 Tax=Glutamicibacter sp. JC586 TaxID=2590552 RepID=UPI00135C6304|nr:DUF5129 domain-containing protein [Glutamicibacter sp. JC586]
MWRTVRRTRVASSLAVIALACLPLAAPAQALSTVQISASENLGTVTVDDTADVINKTRLEVALDNLDFNEPTNVVVYTRNGQYSDDINTKTLQYARSTHPEWISDKPDDYGDYWADGLLIITLSVEGRGDGQIGTYFGEDRKVSTSQMESIHEAGYDDFNLSRWTDGVIAVADKASAIMNRPWYKSPALWWTVAAGGGGAGIVLISTAAMRSARRKSFAQELQSGTEHLTNVTMDLDETEIAAKTLPTGSTHAAELERRFADFLSKYRESFDSQAKLEAAQKKYRSSSRGVEEAKKFKTDAQNLDLTDDAIIAAATLYTRSASWEDAWRAQTKPLADDLAQISTLIDDVEPELQGSAAALASYRESATQSLESLGTQLKAEQLDVDAALDQLSDLRLGLTERLDEFSKAQIEAYAQNEDEKEEMRKEMERSRYSTTGYSPRSGTILDVLNPGALYWSVGSYNAGYSAGTNSVDQSRQSASSSGSVSTGYSGGGSFSGSGGSSRF